MNCAELENLLCDYVDGALDGGSRAAVEAHLAQCAGCAEMARDAAAAVEFMERAADIDPPPELVTRILFELRTAQPYAPARRKALRQLLGGWLEPILQPRFAMGMAMTILSFSMLARLAGVEIRQLRPADLHPVRVWAAVDDRLHRGWERAMKFYDSIRLVYEVQTRLHEWTQQEDEERKAVERGGAAAPASEAAGKAPAAPQKEASPGETR